MAYAPDDHVAGWRGVIRRRAEEFSRRAYVDFLDRTEDCLFYFDPNRLGLHIGIRSIRARELLKSLENSVFKGFVAHEFRNADDGMVWARFGYEWGDRNIAA
jgi:hypothetical protein